MVICATLPPPTETNPASTPERQNAVHNVRRTIATVLR